MPEGNDNSRSSARSEGKGSRETLITLGLLAGTIVVVTLGGETSSENGRPAVLAGFPSIVPEATHRPPSPTPSPTPNPDQEHPE